MTDTVVISLELKAPHSLIEMSTVYQLTTENGAPTQQNQNIFMSSAANATRFFIRLEKKIKKAKD